jgi:hypothetical protein
MNHELNELTENADIVRFIKSRRIIWLSHVMWMDEKRTPKRVLEWKTIGRRIRGRTRKRWIDDVEEDIQGMGINGCRIYIRKSRNGRESLRRLKPAVGCNGSKRRRRKSIAPLILNLGIH